MILISLPGSSFVDEIWRLNVTNTLSLPVKKFLYMTIFFSGNVFNLKGFEVEEGVSARAELMSWRGGRQNIVKGIVQFGFSPDTGTSYTLTSGQSISVRLELRRRRSQFGFCLYHVDCSKGTSLPKTLPQTKTRVTCGLARRIVGLKDTRPLQKIYFRCDEGVWKWKGLHVIFNSTSNSTMADGDAISYPECECKCCHTQFFYLSMPAALF